MKTVLICKNLLKRLT